ncbi:MAG: gliding motility-associated C-terminal domain-containing protein [Saprospiraceae bacterium]
MNLGFKLIVIRLAVVLLSWIGILHAVTAQWCCIDTNLVILDESTQTLRFQINGAVKNDLSDTTQGICGVRLKFEHKFLGDLSVTLVSPSGQSVQLVGPVGKTTPTNFTKWNVTFIPCSQTAIPDKSFKQRWDNFQNWGILGNFYNGTYYPYMKCLEDFNSGPVNGTWSLIIKDEDMFYEGKLEQFCLLFCNDEGINCNTCNANGGYFKQTELEFCKNDPLLNLNLSVNQDNFIPDPLIYGYKYFLLQNDKIIDFAPDLDLRNSPAGDYMICGFSYLLQDSAKIPAINSPNKFTSFKNDVIDGKAGLCGELSKNCIHLVIKETQLPTLLDIKICATDSFEVGGLYYRKTGIYNTYFISSNGCDSIVTLDLTVTDLIAKIQAVKDIDCSNPSVVLDATTSEVPSNATIQWLTKDGNIVDQSNPLKIIVNKKGTYKIVIFNNSCADSIEVEVFNIANVPELIVISDSISCNRPIIYAKAKSNVANVDWIWKNISNQVIGNEDSLAIPTAGKYTVIVTDKSGCSNSQTIEVFEDKTLPIFSLEGMPINCKRDSSIIMVHSMEELINYSWTGPNFGSMDTIVVVKNVGIYSLSASGKNGCVATENIEILSLAKKPDFSYTVKELNCFDSIVQIQPVINAPLKLLEFSGTLTNDTFYSNVFNPMIRISGRYNVRVVDTFDCVLDTFVIVTENFDKADVDLKVADLQCGIDSLQIKLSLLSDPTLLYEYKWTGPIGFNSNLKEPWVHQKGIYRLEITLANGCKSYDSIEVKEDTSRPKIVLLSDTLNCIRNIANINSFVKNAIQYLWSGPGGFTSTDSNLIVSESGFYRLEVTASNGCTSESTTEVVIDTLPTFSGILADTLNCIKKSITLKPIYQSKADLINWTFNNIFYSSNSNPLVSIPGIYTLFTKGINGCIALDSVRIEIDTNRTIFSISTDTLTCLKTMVNISVSPNSILNTYKWFTPIKDSLIASNIDVVKGGQYDLNIVEPNGCLSKLQTEVLEFTSPTIVNFTSDTIRCNFPTVNIQTLNNDPNLKYFWKKADGTNETLANIITQKAGWHYVSITNEYGCVFIDSINVISKVKIPVVSISDTFFNCLNKKNNYIEFTSMDLIDNFFWIDPAQIVFNTIRIDNPLAGNYFLEVNDVNGCKFSKTIQVKYDTVAPLITQLILDTFNCEIKLHSSKISLFDNSASVIWRGPNDSTFYSNKLNPIFNKPGNYTLSIQNSNFCILDTNIQIIIDTISPNFSVSSDSITCFNPRATLLVNSLDTNLSYKWTDLMDPGRSMYFTNPLKVISGGKYEVEVTQTRNRCKVVKDLEVFVDTLAPTININNFKLFCNQDSVQINAISSCPNSRYIWTTPKGQIIELPAPYVSDTGQYILNVICPNLCSAKDSSLFIKRIAQLPQVNISSKLLNCNNDSVQLLIQSGVGDTIIIWSGPNNFNSTLKSPYVREAGNYFLHLSNLTGCSLDTIIIVGIDTIRPDFLLLQLDTFRCDSNLVRIQSIGLNAMNINYQWTSSNGLIVKNSGREIIVSKPGRYNLIERDSTNGCQTQRSLELIETKNPIVSMLVDLTGISCNGESDGSIEIKEIVGGEKNYLYSLNNSTFSNNDVFSNLAPNQYSISVKDKFGCRYDTLVKIANKSNLSLEIFRDSTILLGQSVQLFISTNANGIASLSWNPDTYLSCSNCENPIATPTVTTQYELTLVDSQGCVIKNFVLISVVDEVDFFVPNIFSPNGDGINDLLKITSQTGIEKIVSFEIYDRWGELVYRANHFEPNSQSFGWNGIFKGQTLNPGVYVYHITAKTKLGALIEKYGDVTLIR